MFLGSHNLEHRKSKFQCQAGGNLNKFVESQHCKVVEMVNMSLPLSAQNLISSVKDFFGPCLVDRTRVDRGYKHRQKFIHLSLSRRETYIYSYLSKSFGSVSDVNVVKRSFQNTLLGNELMYGEILKILEY